MTRNGTMNGSVPPGWGEDQLTGFFELGRRNVLASFANLRPAFKSLRDLNELILELDDSLTNSKDWFPALFLLRSHSAYLSAAQMAMAGASPEAQALARLSLENSIYGHFLARYPEHQKTWLRRHDGEEAKRAVRTTFKIGAMLTELESESNPVGQVVRGLYERTIDHGAHPNERALSASLDVTDDGTVTNFTVRFLSADQQVIRGTMVMVAQVGVCDLDIFALLFKERVTILGMDKKVDRIRRHL